MVLYLVLLVQEGAVPRKQPVCTAPGIRICPFECFYAYIMAHSFMMGVVFHDFDALF